MGTNHPPNRPAKGPGNSHKAINKSRHGKDGKIITRKQRLRSYAGMARKKEQEELDIIGTVLDDPNWVAGKQRQVEQIPSHAKLHEDGSDEEPDDVSGSDVNAEDAGKPKARLDKKDKTDKDVQAHERKAKLISSYYPITRLSTFQDLP
eukprot:CAMPEP_0184705224 /NCGR_PEP_ID=MMETSP0313-20130426/33672_1 /TAXON_ID=2792 /ORGANISM="Porphyridium aerugineum, Strain SAG 1380-2" /LENGTH=148 /DNA_ID=CAMNT_0027166511 /DNA_START=119 /DNA_END=561 /DNA_ORIENTATION=-